MLKVNRLREFLLEVKNTIPGINFTDIVVDDSELVSLLKDREEIENNYLIAVMPSFSITGSEDRLKVNNQLFFMVLKKSTDKDFGGREDYINMFGDTQDLAFALVRYILAEKSGDNGELCGLMNELKEDSIAVNPVWRKAQCNGWMIEMDLLSDV